jgi:hypothetical protein
MSRKPPAVAPAGTSTIIGPCSAKFQNVMRYSVVRLGVSMPALSLSDRYRTTSPSFAPNVFR